MEVKGNVGEFLYNLCVRKKALSLKIQNNKNFYKVDFM